MIEKLLGEVCSEEIFTLAEKLELLNKGASEPYSEEELITILEHLDLNEIPVLCKGKDCPFSGVCPLVKANKVKQWIGLDCPIETANIIRHLIGYIRDLNIRMNDYTDLQILKDLIKCHIQMSRCDRLLKLEDPLDVVTTGVDSKTTLKHNDRKVNQLVIAQKTLRADINTAYKQLIASRAAKLQNATKTTLQQNMATKLSEIAKLGQQLDLNEPSRFKSLEIP